MRVARDRGAAAVVIMLGGALALAGAGCSVFHHAPAAPNAGTPESGPAPLPVEKAPEDVIVAAWAEPARLPPAGGQAQILVRLQKRGGAPYPGVQVRLQTSAGTLYSGGHVLVSDSSGHTRDRLTTLKAAAITLNAGGTVYRFRVPLAAPPSS